MFRVSHDQLCKGFRTEADTFNDVLRDIAPDQPVATCPGWSAGHLIGHLQQTFQWGAGMVESRVTTFTSPGDAGQTPQDPATALDWPEQVDQLARTSTNGLTFLADPDKRAAWLLASTDRMAQALEATDPDAPMWTTFGEHKAEFWAHWAAVEMAVHRADAELTAGRTARLETSLALDGTDFVLGSLGAPSAAGLFSRKLAALTGNGAKLYFQATDDHHSGWLATLTPQGRTVETLDQDPPAHPDVTVRANASDLLLLLKGRLPRTAAAIRTTGDTKLLDFWLANSKS